MKEDGQLHVFRMRETLSMLRGKHQHLLHMDERVVVSLWFAVVNANTFPPPRRHRITDLECAHQ
jgi:hypothetical protein